MTVKVISLRERLLHNEGFQTPLPLRSAFGSSVFCFHFHLVFAPCFCCSAEAGRWLIIGWAACLGAVGKGPWDTTAALASVLIHEQNQDSGH